MSVSYKVENVQISAVRDRAMFNTFAGNKSYVIEGIGDELEVSYASNSFIVRLGTGEAVICGGSMTSEGELDTITLNANESGYLVVRVDLSQTGTNQCRFYSTPTIVQENINGGSEYVYDLPLYQYQTSNEGVQNMNDIRNILSSLLGGATFSVENGYVYVIYEVNGETVKKKLGSLDPATLTATPADVLSGKIFGGTGSDEAQTGTMTNYTVTSENVRKEFTPSTSAQSYTIPQGFYKGSNVVKCKAVSLSGDAAVGNVLSGKTFYSNNLTKKTGTMTNNTVSQETTRKEFTPSHTAQSYTIPTGYYSGSNVVKCKAVNDAVSVPKWSGGADLSYTFTASRDGIGVVGGFGTTELTVNIYLGSTKKATKTGTSTFGLVWTSYKFAKGDSIKFETVGSGSNRTYSHIFYV